MKNKEIPKYIVSKNRWDSRLTVKALEKMGVKYKIVIEKSQYKEYSNVIDKNNILILDKKYQKTYETLDKIGFEKSVGPGAARNFAWDHALSEGHKWHWVMDDNIRGFYRYNKNNYYKVQSPVFFRIQEEFCQRYKNAVMAGPNYTMFCPRRTKKPPFVKNTRIYSCNLIRNDIPFRWRGRYNEDTILSLDILTAGLCTIQFNALLQNKAPTQTIKGGNTEDFYSKDGTYNKSKMLVDIYPQYAKLKYKFSRIHHTVNYNSFKRIQLVRKEGVSILNKINNYGLKLKGA